MLIAYYAQYFSIRVMISAPSNVTTVAVAITCITHGLDYVQLCGRLYLYVWHNIHGYTW